MCKAAMLPKPDICQALGHPCAGRAKLMAIKNAALHTDFGCKRRQNTRELREILTIR